MHAQCVPQSWSELFFPVTYIHEPAKQKKTLYESIQDESAEPCFIFHSAHCVLYFPWKI